MTDTPGCHPLQNPQRLLKFPAIWIASKQHATHFANTYAEWKLGLRILNSLELVHAVASRFIKLTSFADLSRSPTNRQCDVCDVNDQHHYDPKDPSHCYPPLSGVSLMPSCLAFHSPSRRSIPSIRACIITAPVFI
jgi:hypothetical protein